jgi:hypothetical protein
LAADCSPNLTWAQRLRRVFAVDLKTCRPCGGRPHHRPEAGDPLILTVRRVTATHLRHRHVIDREND